MISYPKLHELTLSLVSTRSVPGAIIEMGVYQGDTLETIFNMSQWWKKDIYGVDTFKGLPYTESEYMFKGRFNDTSYDSVQKRLPKVSLIQDTVPTKKIDHIKEVSFTHLDMDLCDSTMSALNWLDSRLSTGGVIVIDDFNNNETMGINDVIIDFLSKTENRYKSIVHPAQYFIRKL